MSKNCSADFSSQSSQKNTNLCPSTMLQKLKFQTMQTLFLDRLLFHSLRKSPGKKIEATCLVKSAIYGKMKFTWKVISGRITSIQRGLFTSQECQCLVGKLNALRLQQIQHHLNFQSRTKKKYLAHLKHSQLCQVELHQEMLRSEDHLMKMTPWSRSQKIKSLGQNVSKVDLRKKQIVTRSKIIQDFLLQSRRGPQKRKWTKHESENYQAMKRACKKWTLES